MPPHKIKWLPQALADLERIHQFFELISPVTATKAASAIYEAIELLQTMPNMGNPLTEILKPFRDLIISFGKGDFIIRYRVVNDTIFITYIWHSRENRPR